VRFWVFVLILLLVLAVGVSAAWLDWELRTPYFHASQTQVFADIPRGSGPGAIARVLKEAGILQTRLPFLLYVRWRNSATRLQAGEYSFSSPATPGEIVERLIRGDVFYLSSTIPEGLTARETVDQLAAAELGNPEELENAMQRTDWILDLDPEARSLEGYLFPETYHFSRKATPEKVVKAMVIEFKARFAGLIETRPIPNGWSASQIVTLASLIEKEVKSPRERSLVASVLVNRLKRGVPLACDPTIIYALKLAGRFDGNLRKADLGMRSPYNTYIHAGLPPGPIANPGEESLKAALEPARTDFLYYVSRNDGTHQFSKDLRSHLAAVAAFQKPPAARRGGMPKGRR
jgi:UPF0755 protein